MFYVKKLNPLPLYQNPTILDMCTSFFPSEIKLILLKEYGIRKFLVWFQFSEQIFTYGTRWFVLFSLMRKTFYRH